MVTLTPAQQRIVDAALDLGCKEGADAITSRGVSRWAAVTASSINYHFRSNEGLRQAVGQAALTAQDLDMERALEQAHQVPAHLRSLPNFAAALTTTLATRERGRTLLLAELEPSPAGPDAVPEPFWRSAARSLGRDEHAALWELFFNGVLRMAVLNTDPVASSMWTTRVAQRLDARLHGRCDGRVIDASPTQVGALDRPPLKGRAAEIVNAAVALLLDGQKISHRAVAERAGVALGSTTYFFASKADIVIEAYNELYRLSLEASSPGDSIDAIGSPFSPDGTIRESYYALHQLSLQSAREPAFAPLAQLMMENRGRTSTAHLRQVGIRDADRVDGLIWSLFHGAAQYAAAKRPDSERQTFFEETLEHAWRCLFGSPFQRPPALQTGVPSPRSPIG